MLVRLLGSSESRVEHVQTLIRAEGVRGRFELGQKPRFAGTTENA
jgi:hypothetical protein